MMVVYTVLLYGVPAAIAVTGVVLGVIGTRNYLSELRGPVENDDAAR